MADISNKELQYLVTEMCRGLINEITVVDAYNKFYNSLNSQDFNTIVTKLQGDNEILLPETKWALELYRRKSPRFMKTFINYTTMRVQAILMSLNVLRNVE